MFDMGQTSRCSMVYLMPQSHVSCSFENLHCNMTDCSLLTGRPVYATVGRSDVGYRGECGTAPRIGCEPLFVCNNDGWIAGDMHGREEERTPIEERRNTCM